MMSLSDNIWKLGLMQLIRFGKAALDAYILNDGYSGEGIFICSSTFKKIYIKIDATDRSVSKAVNFLRLRRLLETAAFNYSL